MLENVTLGVEASFRLFTANLITFISHELVIGFTIGFIAATGIYSLLLVEEPKHIPLILAHRRNICFEKIAVKDVDGTYLTSYTEFEKTYNRVKILFYASVLTFLLLLGWSFIFN